MKRPIIVATAISTAFACIAISATATDLYRWVDKDGKVHYSQTPPVKAPATEAKVKIRAPHANAGDPAAPQAERDAQGNCISIKCLGDQMEADRLAREREYARQIAENERATQKKTSEDKQSTPLTSLDEHLRENCRRGLFYGTSSKVNCDDIATLREQWRSHQENIQSGREILQRYPELKEPGYRR